MARQPVNYSANAGAGSQTITTLAESPGWRTALLGTVAAGALWLGLPRYSRADDACVLSGGTTATCTGDQSGGIASGVDFPASYTTLNVNNLTTNIAPAAGIDGIYFRNTTSSIVINSDTGPFAIIANGLNADGIYAFSTGTTAVHHAGAISSASGYGIFAGSTGNLTEVISEGDITAHRMGIAARGSVGVSIENTGDVVSTNDTGILARSYGAGGASIVNRGAVMAHVDGIMAVASGAVTADHEGTILASRDGISATSFGSSIQIDSEGIILAGRTGIDAEAQTAVSVDHFGLILAGARGIEAISLGATVSVTGDSEIIANLAALYAKGPTGVSVDHAGRIVSVAGIGIDAQSVAGPVEVVNAGDVLASSFGIAARASGAARIEQSGDVLSANNSGLYALSLTGAVEIVSSGDVTADRSGILAKTQGNAGTGTNVGIAISSTGNIDAGLIGISALVSGAAAGNDSNAGITVLNRGDVVSRGTVNAGAIYVATLGAASGDRSDAGITIDSVGTLASIRGGIVAGTVGNASGEDSNAGIVIFNRGALSGYYGIYTLTRGNAAGTASNVRIFIDSAGNISSAGGGIYAATMGDASGNESNAGIAILNAGNIRAGGDGISAQALGELTGTDAAGSVDIFTVGNIRAGARGIYGFSLEDSVDIVVDGNIQAGTTGIRADGLGGVTVTAVQVSGGVDGISARNHTAGALSIVATGDVVGTEGSGIKALNQAGTTNLSVTSEAVTGNSFGIDARGYGTGFVKIAAHGEVRSNLTAILARNGTFPGVSGTYVSITTDQDVTGGNTGIIARNGGSAGITILANGDVEGATGWGIYARNSTPGSYLSITTRAVTAGNKGIYAVNYGSGALSIVANGDVVSNDATGIHARNYNGAGTSIVTQGVAGAVFGIDARHYGLGALTIVANGDVTGAGLSGIYARRADGYVIGITIGSASTVSGRSAGVEIVGGEDNSLVNRGAIRNLNGVGFDAVRGGAGNETVSNYGTVTGNVVLAGGVNSFTNFAGATFNSGTVVELGTGNLLTNHGTLAPGGSGTVLATMLTGNLVQPGSALAVDIAGSKADRVNVSGSASMAGLVNPTLLNLDGTTRWTIMTSGAGPIDNGIAVKDSSIVDYELLFPSPTEMVLEIAGIDFTLEGLNRNETAIAENLNAIFAAGGFPKLEPLLTALVNLSTVGDLANALDQLSPEIYLDTEIATLFSSLAFTNALMTCPVRDGAAAFIKEGQCVWARVSGRELEQDQTFQTLGFEETSFAVSGGLQGALGDVWRVGFAAAYERSFLDTDATFASSDADRLNLGASLKYNPGALLLAAAVSGGWGWYDTERPIAFAGFSAFASSEHEIGHVDGRLRAAYQLGGASWYAKPIIDLDATHVSLDGVSEAGGAAALAVRGNDETVLSATPALELGTQFAGPGGTLVRPYVRGGATFFDDPDFVLLASFEGAPGGVGPFRIATATDEVVGNFSAGFDVIGTGGASFRIYYDGRFGDLVEEHAGGIKGTLPF